VIGLCFTIEHLLILLSLLLHILIPNIPQKQKLEMRMMEREVLKDKKESRNELLFSYHQSQKQQQEQEEKEEEEKKKNEEEELSSSNMKQRAIQKLKKSN